jgi:hypothetical protein
MNLTSAVDRARIFTVDFRKRFVSRREGIDDVYAMRSRTSPRPSASGRDVEELSASESPYTYH